MSISPKNSIQNYLEEYKPTSIVVAISGGLDSMLLATILADAREKDQFQMKALHINHGWNEKKSTYWECFCRSWSESREIPFQSQKIFGLQKRSETEARRERYRIFFEILRENEHLCLGHHANDQAETVLLHLLRGSGIVGLSGMERVRRIGRDKFLARPFLNLTRSQLEHFAKKIGLKWINDPSNQDRRHRRNFIRHTIIPLLEKSHWPNSPKTIVRAARHHLETKRLLAEIAEKDQIKAEVDFKNQIWADYLKYSNLCLNLANYFFQLSLERQNNLIRHFLARITGSFPNSKLIEKFRSDLLDSKKDRQPVLRWQDWEIRRYRETIFLISLEEQQRQKNRAQSIMLLKENSIPIIFSGQNSSQQRIRIEVAKNSDGSYPFKKNQLNEMKAFLRPSESTQLASQSPSRRSFKQIFQKFNLPTWWRNETAVIFSSKMFIGIANENCFITASGSKEYLMRIFFLS